MEACITPTLNDPIALEAEVLSLREKVALLEEQIRQLIHKRFGASSEKCSPDQINLFDEAEDDEPEAKDCIGTKEHEITVPTHTRQKAGRKPLPDYIPRIREEHGLTDEEKVCSCCGSRHLHKIGEDISEQLDIIPAKIQVIQHVRSKYACRSCEGAVKTAPMPPQPIPGSIATPGLLAFITTSKLNMLMAYLYTGWNSLPWPG